MPVVAPARVLVAKEADHGEEAFVLDFARAFSLALAGGTQW